MAITMTLQELKSLAALLAEALEDSDATLKLIQEDASKSDAAGRIKLIERMAMLQRRNNASAIAALEALKKEN